MASATHCSKTVNSSDSESPKSTPKAPSSRTAEQIKAEAEAQMLKEQAEERETSKVDQAKIIRTIREALDTWTKRPIFELICALKLGEDKTFLPKSFQDFAKCALEIFLEKVAKEHAFHWAGASPVPVFVEQLQHSSTWTQVADSYPTPASRGSTERAILDTIDHLRTVHSTFKDIFTMAFEKFARETLMKDLHHKGTVSAAQGIFNNVSQFPSLKPEDAKKLLEYLNMAAMAQKEGKKDAATIERELNEYIDQLTSVDVPQFPYTASTAFGL